MFIVERRHRLRLVKRRHRWRLVELERRERHRGRFERLQRWIRKRL